MSSTRDDMFELVFSALDESKARAVWHTLLGQRSFPGPHEDLLHVVVLDRLPLPRDVVLTDVHVRLSRYENVIYDVDLNFYPQRATASSRAKLVYSLFDFAFSVADSTGVATYFAGLEPAVDEDTRWFTGRDKGPLFPPTE